MTPSLDDLVSRAKQHGETHSDSREIIAELCAALKRAYDPCPTCGGKRWLRAPVPHDEVLPGRSCPDCSDGVWSPATRRMP